MPATTAAPIVPPETPLSEELDVVAGGVLPLVDAPEVALAVEDPEAVLPVDGDTTASWFKSEKSKTLVLEQLVP